MKSYLQSKIVKGANDNQMQAHSVYSMNVYIVCLHNLIYAFY